MRFLKISEKIFKKIFTQCHSAEKCKRGTLWGFLTFIVAKYRNKRRGDPLVESKKSRIVPKKILVKTTKRGVLCFRGSGRRCFCFGRGVWTGVSSMFWTSVVQADDVEQMNKKVDRSR